MAEQIEINYELMTGVRNKFKDKAEQIQQLTQILQSQIDELRAGGWIGQGANAFYGEMDNMLLPALGRLQAAMLEAENNCQLISNEFETADEEAKSFVDFKFE